MNHKNKKILMIFIEPTPYILDLLERGFSSCKNQLEIFFLMENMTQNWNLSPNSVHFQIIRSKKNYLTLLYNIFIKRKYALVHLAGWSHFFTILLILSSRFFFVPIAVETDTQLNPNIPTWKKIIKKFLYPILFMFPVFFLPGGTRQALYLNYYGVSNKKIIKAEMTVDIKKIKNYIADLNHAEKEKLRLQYGIQKGDLIFLYVGRLLDWKGIRELISAIQYIHDPRAKLWIVGGGDLAVEVKQAAMMCNKITYFGRINGDFLYKIYFSADVFVLPSHAEPWGLVVNEAMAAGKPLIVTDAVGCIDDLVTNFNEGMIIKPKSETALSKAMCFMLENPEKRNAMADSASKKIEGWTLENEAKNIIFSWEKAMGQKLLGVSDGI